MTPMVSRPLSMEIALLGFLRPGPVHGYQIHELLRNGELGQVWHLKQAQLYALLSKLEELGYIHSAIQPQETRPARRMFQLTPAGQETFLGWLSSPVARPRDLRQEFQARLYFARREGRPVYERLIAAQQQACQEWLAQEQAERERYAENTFPRLVREFRVGQIQATLDWLNICQAAHPWQAG